MQRRESTDAVAELALGLLNELPILAEELVVEIQTDDPAYAGVVPSEDLRRSVRDNMAEVIRAVAGVRDSPDRLGPPRATGRRRAEQGLPLESLLHSYRIGGRIIWQHMVQRAREGPRDRLDALLDGATSVWDAIDEYSTVVGESYRATEAQLARIDLQRQAATVEALLEGDGRSSALPRARELLGGSERLVVIVLERGPQADMREPTAALRRAGIRAIWQERPPGQVGVLALHDIGEADLIATLRSWVRGRAGVSLVVDGLRELPAAYEQAEIALRIAGPAPDVALLGQRLREGVAAAAGSLGALLEERVLGAVDLLPSSEASDLLDTAHAFIATGSAASAARRLHCHRNTVLNRLNRLAELTGLDLQRPAELATLVLALDVRRVGQVHSPTE